MLPTINGKSLLDCELEELQVLIDNSDYRENEYLEYKESFKVDKCEKNEKPKAIAELRNDVCAFANADGGYIIFGIKEDGKGVVQELTGIDIAENNTDKFELNLKTYLQAISPRPPAFKTNFVKLESGKYIVIIFVQHDFFAPYIHLVEEKNYRIYKRVNSSKEVIKYAELKKMFTQSLSIEKEIEHFRNNQIAFYKTRTKGFPFFLLHLIPDTFLDSSYDKPYYAIAKKNPSIFHSLNYVFECDSVAIPTIKGVKFEGRGIDAECRYYNNAIVECFSSKKTFFYNPSNQLDIIWDDLWEPVFQFITTYHKRLAKELSSERVFACFSLIGAQGATITADYKNRIIRASEGTIDRYDYLCEPVIFDLDKGGSGLDKNIKMLQLELLMALGIHNLPTLNELIGELYPEYK